MVIVNLKSLEAYRIALPKQTNFLKLKLTEYLYFENGPYRRLVSDRNCQLERNTPGIDELLQKE